VVNRRALILLLAGAFVLFVFNTWAYDLWAPDEPFFGDGARAMLQDEHWLVTHVNGRVNLHKPPFFFWLIALCSAATGGTVTSFAARLPSALAALLALALTYRLGRRAWGETTALSAAAILATSYLFWDKARTAQIEATLLACVLGALLAFDAFRAGEMDGRRAGIVFWVCGALGTLAKGPVGFLIPLGIALCTLAWDRDLRAWRRFAPFAGPLAFLVVAGLWAVPAELFGGTYSVVAALKTHFFGRALHGMHHKNPPWYYLGTIPLHMLPWSLLLPGALWSAWKRRGEPMERFLLAWAAFVVVFFSVSGERRDLYVLPAFPTLALLIARLVAVAPRRQVTLPQGILGAILVVAGAAVPFAARRLDPPPTGQAIVVGVAVVAAGIAIVAASLRGRRAGAVLAATAGGMAVVYIAVCATLLPFLNPRKSARVFSERLAAETQSYRAAGGRVMAYRMGNVPNAISYFTGVHTLEESDGAAFAAHLAAAPPRYAVSDVRELEKLPDDVRSRLRIVARDELSRVDAVLVETN
jgi:4-amino-4-deoxy-L-arabinose transferase-like glycosyltransferase